MYRPSDCSFFFDKFSVVMDNLWRSRSNIIVLSDFNVNLSSSCDLLLKRKCTSLLCKFNLKNVIDVPTRVTDNTSSLSDLIITSVPYKISSHGACNPGISNHHLVYAAVNLRGISEKPKLKRVRDFKRVDIKALQLWICLYSMVCLWCLWWYWQLCLGMGSTICDLSRENVH